MLDSALDGRWIERWLASFSWVVAVLAVAMSLGSVLVSPPWLAAGGPVTGLGFVGFFVWTFVIGVACFRLEP